MKVNLIQRTILHRDAARLTRMVEEILSREDPLSPEQQDKVLLALDQAEWSIRAANGSDEPPPMSDDEAKDLEDALGRAEAALVAIEERETSDLSRLWEERVSSPAGGSIDASAFWAERAEILRQYRAERRSVVDELSA